MHAPLPEHTCAHRPEVSLACPSDSKPIMPATTASAGAAEIPAGLVMGHASKHAPHCVHESRMSCVLRSSASANSPVSIVMSPHDALPSKAPSAPGAGRTHLR